MTPIADSETLAAFCQRQTKAGFVAVDTEFMRDKTYWPQLCLVQVAGPDEAAAIDPLAPGIDLRPLYDLMAEATVLKVFHAARQDIEIFFNLAGAVPTPIFDTQVAAMVCGFGEAVSYETLASRLAGAHIDKSSRFTDWAQRPLTERQLAYALADVVPLRLVYEKLAARLATSGRSSWLAEEMAVLTDPATYRLDPAEAWRRLRLRSNNRRLLAMVQALAAWREQAAQQRNLPRNRVLRDESLLEIAAHAPHSVTELARTRGLGKSFAEGKFGAEILAVVARVLETPGKRVSRTAAAPRIAGRARSAHRPAPRLVEAALRGARRRPEAGRRRRGSRAHRRRRPRRHPGAARLAPGDLRPRRARPEARQAGAHRRRQAHQAGADQPARRGARNRR